MTNETLWFGTLIRTDNINVDNESLTKFSYDLNKQLKHNYDGSVANGWQSSDLDNYDVLQPLKKEILRVCNELHQKLELKDKAKQMIANMWININPLGGFNIPHNHPGSIFSGVYYIKCNEDSGNLCFTHPAINQNYHFNSYSIERHNNLNAGGVQIEPEVGKLVIFPSYQSHYVQPNKSKEDRISIAFNTKLHYELWPEFVSINSNTE